MASTQPPTRICLFCGASPGASPAHLKAANSLAKTMHTHGVHLVYGGGTTGLMGEVARTLVELSGKDAVIGVIPSSLLGEKRPDAASPKDEGGRKVKLPGNWATRMGFPSSKAGKRDLEPTEHERARLLLEERYGPVIMVPDLPARKKKMMELTRAGGPGSGFVALSGGIGTIDELMEVLEWKRKGAHRMGACVLNVGGFWDGLLGWMEKAAEEHFVRGDSRQVLGSVTEPEEVVGWLKGYEEGRGRRGPGEC
ncbi:MAG: hypothetical protein Q9211_004749 [Gyalolechia sp. 1 TL-2023]